LLLTPVRHLSFATLEPGLGDGADPPKAAIGAHAAPSRTADGASGRTVSRVGQTATETTLVGGARRRAHSSKEPRTLYTATGASACTRSSRASAGPRRSAGLGSGSLSVDPDSGRSMKRPAPGLGLHGHARARARSTARSARRAAAAAARLARALAALHTQPLHSAATVMMTEATSDESVADSNTCMAPVPLRREETMVAGRQVPSRATKTRKLAVRPSLFDGQRV
jgi:hypothetical protein